MELDANNLDEADLSGGSDNLSADSGPSQLEKQKVRPILQKKTKENSVNMIIRLLKEFQPLSGG